MTSILRRVEKLEEELMAGHESPRAVIEVVFVDPVTRQVTSTRRFYVGGEETPAGAESATP